MSAQFRRLVMDLILLISRETNEIRNSETQKSKTEQIAATEERHGDFERSEQKPNIQC